MDVTTLALAVDSTQVNTASVALQKMAAEGFKAETVAAKLANTAALQGRALNTGIVRNAAAAAESIRNLTSATSSLSAAQDFTRTTASLSAATAQANAATGAVRAFGAAIAASAAAGASTDLNFQQPRTTTVQQIAQAPVSVIARNAPQAAVDSRGTAAASAALDKLTGQTKKAEDATASLTTAVRAQGGALGAGIAANAERAAVSMQGLAAATGAVGAASGVAATSAALSAAATQANAAAAAIGNMNAAASRASAGAASFNPFAGVGGAASTAAKGVTQLGQANKLTGMQAQQLSYQLNDLFVQISSGQSPLMALIQQGSQLNGTFGGIGGTFRALGTLITPTTAAIGGAAVAVGGLAYAYMQGAAQSKAFNDAVLLSGNYAGQTNGSINRLAESVAESTKTSTGSVREFANALIATGEIGPRAMGLATDAVVRYGEATGKTAQEAAADFAKMARDPAKFAQELNKSWNLWTAAELEAVEAMQEGGRVGDAQVAVLTKMQERLQGLHKNLGDVENAQRTLTTGMGNLKDAFFAIGRDRTLEDRLKELQGILNRPAGTGFFASIENGLNALSEFGGLSKQKRDSFNANSPNAREEYRTLQGENFRRLDRENDRAFEAAAEKETTERNKRLEAIYKRAKPSDELKKALDRNKADFAAAAERGAPIPADKQKAINEQTRKELSPAKGAGGSGASEAGQVLREQLAEDLSAFKIALEREKEALAFHQREMQGVYQAGGISLKAFFDDKRATIADGVNAEIGQLDKEIARLKEYQAAIKDPSEKIKTGKQIGQVEAQKENVRTTAERDGKLINQEEAASFKQLNDQIVNYNANLLQMAGDEIGAARLRAQVTIDNARILAAQGAKDAAGNPVNVDVSALQRAITVSNEFAEVQRRAGDLAQNAARAQEATYLAAEAGGKSLREIEDAIYAVRAQELTQLGALAAKARELADASTDPKIKQYAADLALAYAKAADAIDPALNRLRDAQKELAAGVANTLNQGLATLPQEYSQRRQEANKEVKEEKDRYDRRIEIQQGYLATAARAEERARIQKRIKDLESQRDNVKGESKGSSLLQSLNTNILQPMASGVFATVNKLLVTDPLQKYLENQFRSMTEGGGVFASFFKDALGIKDAKVDPKVLAEQAAATATNTLSSSLTAQTGAVQASTLALEALANAANSAAGAGPSRPLQVEAGARQAAPSFGDFTRADRALGAAQSPAASDPATAQALADARTAVDTFGGSATTAANDIVKLAQAAGQGGGALGLLPSIVSLFQAAVAATSAGSAASGSGGIMGAFSGLFSGGGASTGAAASDVVTSFYFHTGGVVGGPGRIGSVPSSAFAGAPRYHTGGLVGSKPDGARAALAAAALKAGEVPAILMKREEVLREDDPRHRDNLGSDVFAKIMQSKGENSASVLQGLLSRMGVKDQDDSAMGSALKVAGARELGGPVSAGKLYRVNEKRTELLNVGNKQYLMMGAQGGSVDPNPQQSKSAGGLPPIIVNMSPPAGSNAATVRQWGVMAGREIQTSMRRNG